MGRRRIEFKCECGSKVFIVESIVGHDVSDEPTLKRNAATMVGLLGWNARIDPPLCPYCRDKRLKLV